VEARGHVGAREDPEELEAADGDAEGGRLERVAPHEALDDELAKVGEAAVDNLVEQGEEREEPDLWVQERLFDLGRLDLLVEDSCAAELAAGDESGAVLQGELLRRDDVVGEEQEEDDPPQDGEAAAEDENDPPRRESFDLAEAVG